MERSEAIIGSAVRRFRPIVLTAMTAVLALIPISRAVFWGPLAYAMMGGIMVATVLDHPGAAGGLRPYAQMYIMGTVLRHGSAEQKQRYLPGVARGELRLQAFGVTEPDAGSETTRLKTTAVRRGDRYIVNGQKVWTSRAAALRPAAAARAHHAVRRARPTRRAA